MPASAKVVLDSIGPNGIRLTSVELRYPRFIHSEMLTHRDRARNSASSRAIPWKKMKDGKLVHNCMVNMIVSEPVVPLVWGREQSTMQTGPALSGPDAERASEIWMRAMTHAVRAADELHTLGVHKSLCNRLTEPFMWITALYTATEWKNFFRLRCHPDAEIHMQHIAGLCREAIEKSEPQKLIAGQWHTPYILDADRETVLTVVKRQFSEVEGPVTELLKKISAARCARLSYLTHDGVRDIDKDVELYKKLIVRDDDVIHCSPLEHVAEASNRTDLRSGPFRGWKQFRKEFANENIEG